MSKIDLNCIGRELYKEYYKIFSNTDIYKKRLPLNIENNIKKELQEILKKSTFDRENLVESLKNLLLLCYIFNIDLNDYINLEFYEED